MKEIKFVDTTFRDAHQCLWATRMTTAMMLPVAKQMDQIGFSAIDVGGNLYLDVCVRFLKENPWERMRLLRERLENTPMWTGLRSKCGIGFDFVPDDIAALMLELLIKNGLRQIMYFDALFQNENLIPNLKLAKRLGAQTVGGLVFSLSPVHTDELYASKAAELVEKAGVDCILIKDSGGLLTPDRVRTLVPAMRQAIGTVHLSLHSHCTTGLAPLVYLEGLKAGVDSLHTSIAPLASGPAQPPTQTTLRNVRLSGYQVNLNEALIDEVSAYFQQVADQENKPVGKPVEYDAYHYVHQVPGGMMENLRFHLGQVGMSDKYDQVLEECVVIRKELGWPIMVTPFSQLVGTQAVLNLIYQERYKVVPDELKQYALGYYGQLLAPIEPNVLDQIVENGSKSIALQPPVLEPAVSSLRKRYPHMRDEERLLRYMFKGSEVDEMQAAPPIEMNYSIVNPIVRLIEELAKRPSARRVFIQKGSFKVEVGG